VLPVAGQTSGVTVTALGDVRDVARFGVEIRIDGRFVPFVYGLDAFQSATNPSLFNSPPPERVKEVGVGVESEAIVAVVRLTSPSFFRRNDASRASTGADQS
jgi:hypothetical protein